MASAFNPDIGFQRTKTLMRGDDCCDHIYYLKHLRR
ncbi:L-2-amino-thiazoline-4-carboxylic acid hydrolase [Chloroflexota bacterium]